jgi:hypothetical protein
VDRSSISLVVVTAAALFVASPCSALANVSPGDASATRAYLQADYAATRAEVASFPAAIAAVEALAGRLTVECPGALANAPKPAQGERPSSSEILIAEEEEGAALGAGVDTEYARRRTLARTVSRLRWSSRALTRLVHSDAEAEVALAQLPVPDLCADIDTWVGSGYQTVAPATESYVRRESELSATTSGAEKAIASQLARYEDPSDKRIAHQIAKLDKTTLPADVAELLTAMGKVAEALNTAPSAPAP